MLLSDEIFCRLRVAAGIRKTEGGGRQQRVPCSRAGGSVPSLIAVRFACLYDGER